MVVGTESVAVDTGTAGAREAALVEGAAARVAIPAGVAGRVGAAVPARPGRVADVVPAGPGTRADPVGGVGAAVERARAPLVDAGLVEADAEAGLADERLLDVGLDDAELSAGRLPDEVPEGTGLLGDRVETGARTSVLEEPVPVSEADVVPATVSGLRAGWRVGAVAAAREPTGRSAAFVPTAAGRGATGAGGDRLGADVMTAAVGPTAVLLVFPVITSTPTTMDTIAGANHIAMRLI